MLSSNDPSFDDGAVGRFEFGCVRCVCPEILRRMFELIERSRDPSRQASASCVGAPLEIRIDPTKFART